MRSLQAPIALTFSVAVIALPLFLVVILSARVAAAQSVPRPINVLSTPNGQDAKGLDMFGIANTWLRSLDANEFSDTWYNADPTFKARYPQASWKDTMDAMRAPFGKIISRADYSLSNISTNTGTPGASTHIIVSVKSKFTNREAVEAVEFVRTGEDEVKVTNYTIK